MTRVCAFFSQNLTVLGEGGATINLRRITMELQGRDVTRELVRRRDNYECQDCHKKWKIGERRFDCHHINGMCGKLTKKYESAKHISGMITLCHKCHFNRPEHRVKSIDWHGGAPSKVPREKYGELKIMRQKMTLQQIGTKFGVSRQRIHQILLSTQ